MATNEVSDILTISDCLKEANVYGVQVPGDVHFLCTFFTLQYVLQKCHDLQMAEH